MECHSVVNNYSWVYIYLWLSMLGMWHHEASCLVVHTTSPVQRVSVHSHWTCSEFSASLYGGCWSHGFPHKDRYWLSSEIILLKLGRIPGTRGRSLGMRPVELGRSLPCSRAPPQLYWPRSKAPPQGARENSQHNGEELGNEVQEATPFTISR